MRLLPTFYNLGRSKIVLDDVLRSRKSHAGAMNVLHQLVGTDRIAVLEFACLAVLGYRGARCGLHLWREVSDH